MKFIAFAAVVLTLSSAAARAGQDPAINATVQAEFTDEQLSPSHWKLTLHPDGSGHFSSQMGKPSTEDTGEIDIPNLDRDVKLSTAFASHVFQVALRHHEFNEECDGRLKVAFQGWKKLSYSGPEGSGSCTYNFSQDKEIQALGDSMQAVAETILEGARIEKLLQHDRLGLDKEMEYLVDAAGSGRAKEFGAIREILVRLADDDQVLERVRKRARMLLAQAGT
ncbi:MAG TPA: hypothetical protein VL986_01135 [Terracidiphilus sp.]|nr:hypothetical protein [Terracidiphilus sp.]